MPEVGIIWIIFYYFTSVYNYFLYKKNTDKVHVTILTYGNEIVNIG